MKAVPVLVVGLLALMAPWASGAVWTVSGAGGADFSTIVAAVSAASGGDTVLIGPGTYHEFVKVSGEKSGLWLVGDGGPAGVILSADTVAIGIWSADPAVHVRNLTITSAQNFGAVYLQESKAEISGCVLRDNIGPGGCTRVGGAIHANYQSDVVVEDCIIEANDGWGAPGGVIIWQSRGDIRRNIFRNNHACYGGGLEMYHCETEPVSYIEGNIFVNNSGSIWGGGIFNVDSSPVIRNNTFFGNDATSNAAIWVLGGQPTIAGNIMVGSDWGIFCQSDPQYPASLPVVGCNLFWNMRLGVAGDCAGAGSVILQDPLFCDPAAGNFSLCADSPAVSDICGAMGALGIGCGPCAVSTTPTTWGRIKASVGK